LNPDVEPLPGANPAASIALESRLAGIQENLDRIGQAIAREAQREAPTDPAAQAAELLKHLQQARAIDKLASQINEQIAPDGAGSGDKRTVIEDEHDAQPVEPRREPSLDAPTNLPAPRPHAITKIYHPRHVGGSALQALVAPLLTDGLGKIGAADAASEEATPGSPAASASALVVHDTPEVLRKVDRLIEKIDVPPTPVAIEAVILSLRLPDGMSQGIDLLNYNSKGEPFVVVPADGSRLGSVASRGTSSARPSGAGSAGFDGRTLTRGFGLKCGILTGDPQAFVTTLQAAAQTSRVNAWQVSVSNRHSADLMLNEPFGATLTGKPALVGARLKVRPVVARNGLIHLDVHSESDLDAQSSGTRAASLNNQFSLEQGQTAIIAGFFAEQAVLHYYSQAGDSQFSFFGKKTIRSQATEGVERTETIVLLTPHVVNPEVGGEVGKAAPAARKPNPAVKRESSGAVRLAGGVEDDAPARDAGPERRKPATGTRPSANSTAPPSATAREPAEPQPLPATGATPMALPGREPPVDDRATEADLSEIPALAMPELEAELKDRGPRITPGRSSKSDF
jgi:type II secretory pathway component GspD/PulD (secretin)